MARQTLMRRFWTQFYSTSLQKMERGIVIQEPKVLGRSSRNRWSISHQPSSRAVIDIGDIDISIKMSCDIDIDIENVDIDILELGVTPVVELASLTTNTLK